MGKIIAVANQKGGVGKTTTSINLSAALAEVGNRILAVDFDPQGNLTSGVGEDKNADHKAVYDMLTEEAPPQDIIIHTSYDRLDIMPTGVDLSGAEIELLDMPEREQRLSKGLSNIKDDYDFIIIDCPPSLSLLTINALTAADSVLVPIQCEYYALEGLDQVIKTIGLVRDRYNERLRIEGVVFTMFDARNNLSQQVVDSVKEALHEHIFDTLIPRNVRLAEAPSHGMPVTAYDPHSFGAERYRMLAREIIERKNM